MLRNNSPISRPLSPLSPMIGAHVDGFSTDSDAANTVEVYDIASTPVRRNTGPHCRIFSVGVGAGGRRPNATLLPYDASGTVREARQLS